MIGSAGPHFDFNYQTPMTPEHETAKRITFFSLGLSIALAWSPLAADYYVYLPAHIKSSRTFLVTVFGATLGMSIVLLMGVGLGTVIASSAHYATKYGTSPGGVLMTAYDGLGGFGKFCAVVNVLALVANNTPGAYSMGMNIQMIGGKFGKVPKPVFTTVATVIYASCAMGGRNQLYEVFKSFLPLIGYWVMIFVVIVFEEDMIFRRNRGYDWSQWNCRDKLPMGIAAAVTFLIGWAGAIVGMVSLVLLLTGRYHPFIASANIQMQSQAYYIGPIAQLAGDADLGLWLAAGFTAVFFPPLRALELLFIGR
jgi:purine-cytosine permease-like protein